MMKHLLTLLVLFSSTGMYAQKFDFAGDTLLVDGKPYVMMLQSGTKLQPAFSVQNFEEDELMLIEAVESGSDAQSNQTYVFTFTGLDEYSARLQPTVPIKKSLAKQIVRFKLIGNDGQLDEQAVAKFAKVNYGDFKENELKAPSKTSYVPDDYPIVERNTSAKVQCASGSIRQDTKLIGKYKYESRSNKGLSENVVEFYTINNIKIAEATYLKGSANCDIIIFKNNKVERLEISTPTKVVDEVAAYLVDMGHL